MSYITQPDPGRNHLNPGHHGVVGDVADAFSLDGGLADQEHFAGVAMPAALDHGNVDIDDVAIFQPPLAGNSVADHVIDRGTNGFWKSPIIQGRRYGILLHRYVLVTDIVQFSRGHAGLDIGRIMRSTSAASWPATRIFAISSLFFSMIPIFLRFAAVVCSDLNKSNPVAKGNIVHAFCPMT